MSAIFFISAFRVIVIGMAMRMEPISNGSGCMIITAYITNALPPIMHNDSRMNFQSGIVYFSSPISPPYLNDVTDFSRGVHFVLAFKHGATALEFLRGVSVVIQYLCKTVDDGV